MLCQAFLPSPTFGRRPLLDDHHQPTAPLRRPRPFQVPYASLDQDVEDINPTHTRHSSLLSSLSSTTSASPSSPTALAAEALSAAILKRQTSRIPARFKTALSARVPISVATFRHVVSTCQSARDVRAVSSVIKSFLSTPSLTSQLRIHHLVSPIHFIATAGHSRSVLTILDLMNMIATTTTNTTTTIQNNDETKYSVGVHPDARLVVSLASAAVDRRAYQDSIRYISWMTSNGIVLNAHAYSVLLKCYGREGNVVAVKQTIFDSTSQSLEMDSILLNSALDALVRCKDVRAAQQMLLNQSYTHIVDVSSYNTVIKGVVSEGRVRDAFRVASRMQATGISIDAITVNTLISACVTANDFDTARKLVTFYIRPSNQCYDTTDNDKSLVRLKAPSPPRPPQPSPKLKQTLLSRKFNTVSKEHNGKDNCNDNNGVIDAEPIIVLDLSALKEDKNNLHDVNSDDIKDIGINNGILKSNKEIHFRKQLRIALTTLLCGFAEKGRIHEAFDILRDMRARSVEPNSITYASLISACFKQGLIEEAMSLFHELCYDGNRDNDNNIGENMTINCDIIILNAVINGLCRHTHNVTCVEEAGDIIEHVLKLQISRPQKQRKSTSKTKNNSTMKLCPETLNSLIDGFVRFRKFDRAEQLLLLMKRYRIRPTTASYTTLMHGYTNARQYTSAKRTFRQMTFRKLRPDRVALNALIAACARSGDWTTAMRVLSFMERQSPSESTTTTTTTTITTKAKSNLSPSAQSYSPLLMVYAKERRHTHLWNMYVRMRKHGVPLNDYLMTLLCDYVVKVAPHMTNDDDLETLAEHSGELLRNGLEDGVPARALRSAKRKLLPMFPLKLRLRYFGGTDSTEFRFVSETIFERHGWNDIDSGWRVL